MSELEIDIRNIKGFEDLRKITEAAYSYRKIFADKIVPLDEETNQNREGDLTEK